MKNKNNNKYSVLSGILFERGYDPENISIISEGNPSTITGMVYMQKVKKISKATEPNHIN